MTGFYPTSEQACRALVTQPQNDPRPMRWYQLFKELPTDPWGSEYIYRSPGLKNRRLRFVFGWAKIGEPIRQTKMGWRLAAVRQGSGDLILRGRSPVRPPRRSAW